MRDIIVDIDKWLKEERSVAEATVIETWGSSPRSSGAKMAITSTREITGSVSGGCVESAVADIGLDVLRGEPPQLVHYGVSDDEAWDVGLACGGTIEVFVERLSPSLYTVLASLLKADEPFLVATIVGGTVVQIGQKMVVNHAGEIVFDTTQTLTNILHKHALQALKDKSCQRRRFTLLEPAEEEVDVFFQFVDTAPKLVIVGGVHIAIALSRIAKELGYRTVVIDPRRIFSSTERFGAVDQLIQEWPSKAFERVALTGTTAVALLTHDPKIDDPAAIQALSSPAFYVGALGSRKTHSSRLRRLREMGVSEEQLARIHAPIGVNIGAQSPEEIAVAIMAEIIEAKNAR